MAWSGMLSPDLVSWLLEPSNAPVRYGTLRDLLDRPPDDPEVQAARSAIPSFPAVAELLARQKPDGYWFNRDFYLPKTYGTFWTLSVLADAGLTRDHEQIERACEFIFTFQREHGAFCRRRRVAGKGLVWREEPGPCTHARIVRFLIQFGYGDDPRTRAGMDWLLGAQREDGTWDCHPTRRYGCLRATHDVLRAAALDYAAASHPAVREGAAIVLDLLMEVNRSRYHTGGEWTTLVYPHFGVDVISTLDALARLGFTREQAQIARGFDYLLSRRLPGGAWPLDGGPTRPPFSYGEVGQPNKWVTLDALRVIRLLEPVPAGEQVPGTVSAGVS